ncbi:hypothetical protein BDV39DRAFT_101471 [Aspergillus sergii]|uniref:Uncharacterized protein n=1 Tax=Aspergillus sergii TaxID=1034303 RepID=A0A5N6WYU1_9EURO|nr:hypothetical protein BDV39DRAFT_101471 [Aspergillus sergii]
MQNCTHFPPFSLVSCIYRSQFPIHLISPRFRPLTQQPHTCIFLRYIPATLNFTHWSTYFSTRYPLCNTSSWSSSSSGAHLAPEASPDHSAFLPSLSVPTAGLHLEMWVAYLNTRSPFSGFITGPEMHFLLHLVSCHCRSHRTTTPSRIQSHKPISQLSRLR